MQFEFQFSHSFFSFIFPPFSVSKLFFEKLEHFLPNFITETETKEIGAALSAYRGQEEQGVSLQFCLFAIFRLT